MSTHAVRRGTQTGGLREHLGIYVRSAWENNVASFLQWRKTRGDIRDWKYEPRTFWFEQIRRGARSYTPDFEVVENKGRKECWEVKGHMDPKSQTKLKRMAQQYPAERVVVIDGQWFASMERRRLCRLIPGWECSHAEPFLRGTSSSPPSSAAAPLPERRLDSADKNARKESSFRRSA